MVENIHTISALFLKTHAWEITPKRRVPDRAGTRDDGAVAETVSFYLFLLRFSP